MAEAWTELSARPVEPLLSANIGVAFSGGLDSSVLLHAGARAGLWQHSFTIDHGLQNGSADWASFCQTRSAALGIAHSQERVTVIVKQRDRQQGIEQAARKARYKALFALARHARVDVIALAHHADDQAETFLLQALRGAGLPGLSGMPALTEATEATEATEGITLWRPLLGCSRLDLEAYAEKHRVAFVEDPSNQQLHYTRNALRHTVMPAIEKLAPEYRKTLGRVTKHLAQAQQWLASNAASLLKTIAVDANQLNADRYAILPLIERHAVLRQWLVDLRLRAMSEARLNDLDEKLLATQRASLSQGTVLIEHENYRFTALKTAHDGWIVRAQSKQAQSTQLGTYSNEDNNEDNNKVSYKKSSQPTEIALLDKKKWRQACATNARVEWRLRQGQERLQLHKNRPSRSLKNLYQEANVPVVLRQSQYLLFVNDELVFVPGVGTHHDWQPKTPSAIFELPRRSIYNGELP